MQSHGIVVWLHLQGSQSIRSKYYCMHIVYSSGYCWHVFASANVTVTCQHLIVSTDNIECEAVT
jgi:hypothetical protein